MTPLSSTLPRPLLQAWERHGRHLPGLASLLLAVWLTQTLAQMAWQLLPRPVDLAWQPPPPSLPAHLASGPKAVDTRAIASAHLFGEFVEPADPAAGNVEDIRDTRLNLTLLGILAASGDRGSRALISQQSGDEKPYAVGQEVVSGVKLQAIYPDRVILARGSQLETLRLDKDRPARPLPAGLQNRSQPVDEDEEGDEATEAAEILSDIRAEVLQDPSKASEYIRVQPANVGGTMKGYRIYPGRDRSIFSSAGLRPGDLVTQINGIQLDDPAKAMQMLGDLSASNNLTVVVERGGQQQTVNVNLN